MFYSSRGGPTEILLMVRIDSKNHVLGEHDMGMEECPSCKRSRRL